MKTLFGRNALSLHGCLCLAALAIPAAATPAMPSGSFLRAPAPTAQALNHEIAADPVVCGRYARLYKISPAMVRMAFSKLRLTTLSSSREFEVHYVHPGEKIGYKVTRLTKGTPIYVLPDGTPVLVRICGNPVRITPSHVVRGAKLTAPQPGLPGEETIGMIEPAAPALAANPIDMTPEETRDATPGEDFIPLPTVPAAIPGTPGAIAPAALPVAAIAAVHGFALSPALLLLPLGGLALIHSGGQSSSSTPPGGTVTPPVIPPAGGHSTGSTPEPGSVAAGLALALSATIGLRRRRRA